MEKLIDLSTIAYSFHDYSPSNHYIATDNGLAVYDTALVDDNVLLHSWIFAL